MTRILRGAAIALLAAALILAATPAAAAAATPPVTIDAVRVQLLYSQSGQPSVDLAGPQGFSTWNAIIGEGGAAGPADDVLVSVRLSTSADELNLSTPLVVTARTGGKTLATRTFRTLFFKGGKATAWLFLPNATCAGKVAVTATLGARTKTSSVEMACGE